MSQSLPSPYTNQASAETLRKLDDDFFTEQQLAELSEEARAHVLQQLAYRKTHPTVAIYRCATAGSQSRDGGVIQLATSPMEITLEDGQQVRVAQVGDCVVYADGRTAQIISGAGRANSNVALVGSALCNGDEIVNTPQGRALYHLREGVPMTSDFLLPMEA